MLAAQKEFLSKTYGARVILLELSRILELSSTGLRGHARGGKGRRGALAARVRVHPEKRPLRDACRPEAPLR
jgi:hypothetical protein